MDNQHLVSRDLLAAPNAGNYGAQSAYKDSDPGDGDQKLDTAELVRSLQSRSRGEDEDGGAAPHHARPPGLQTFLL